MSKKVIEFSKKGLLFVSLIILVAWVIVSSISITVYGYELWEGTNKVYNIFTLIAGISLIIAYGSYRSLGSLRESIEYIINQVPRKWHQFIDSTYTPYFTPEVYVIKKGKYTKVVDNSIPSDEVGLPIVDTTAPLVSFNSDIYMNYFGEFLDDSTEIKNNITNYLKGKSIFDSARKTKHIYNAINSVLMVVVVGKTCIIVRPKVKQDILIHRSNYSTFIGEEVTSHSFNDYIKQMVDLETVYKRKLIGLSWLLSNTVSKPSEAEYGDTKLYKSIKKEVDSLLILQTTIPNLNPIQVMNTLLQFLKDPHHDLSFMTVEDRYCEGFIGRYILNSTTSIVESARLFINSSSDIIFQRDVFDYILDESRLHGINIGSIFSSMYQEQSIRECIVNIRLLIQNVSHNDYGPLINNMISNNKETEAGSIDTLLPYISDSGIKSLIKKHNRDLLKKQLKNFKLLKVGISLGNPMNYFKDSSHKYEIMTKNTVGQISAISNLSNNTQNAAIDIIHKPVTDNVIAYANAESKIEDELHSISPIDENSKERISKLKTTLSKLKTFNEKVKGIIHKKKQASSLMSSSQVSSVQSAKAIEDIYSDQKELEQQEKELLLDDVILSTKSDPDSKIDNITNSIANTFGISSETAEKTISGTNAKIQASEELIEKVITESNKLPLPEKQKIIQRVESIKLNLGQVKSQTKNVINEVNRNQLNRRHSIGPIQMNDMITNTIEGPSIYTLEQQVKGITNEVTNLNAEVIKMAALQTVKSSFDIGLSNVLKKLSPLETLQAKDQQLKTDSITIANQMNMLDPSSQAYKELQNRYSQLVSESDNIKKQIIDMRQNLENKEMQIDDLSMRLQAKEESFKTNQQEQLKQLELKNEQMNELSNQIVNQKANYDNQINQLTISLNTNQQQLTNLQYQLSQANQQSAEYNTLKQNYNNIVNENSNISQQLSRYRGSVETLKSQYEHAQTEIQQLRNQIQNQQSTIDEDKVKLAEEYNKIVNQSEQKRKEAQLISQQLENEMMTQKQKLNELTEKLTSGTSEAKKMKIINLMRTHAALESKKQEKIRFETETERIKAEIQSNRSTNAMLLQETQKQLKEISDLKVKLENTANLQQTATNQNEAKRLQEDIQKKQAFINNLEQEQLKREKIMNQLRNEVLLNEDKLKVAEETIAHHENAVEEVTKENGKLNEALKSQISQMASLKSEYEKFKAKQVSIEENLLDQIDQYQKENEDMSDKLQYQSNKIETLQNCVGSLSKLESNIFTLYFKERNFRVGSQKIKVHFTKQLFDELITICKLSTDHFLKQSEFNTRTKKLMSMISESFKNDSSKTNMINENLGKLISIILSVKWYIDNVIVGQVLLRDGSSKDVAIIELITMNLQNCGVKVETIGPEYLPNIATVIKLNNLINEFIDSKLVHISEARGLVKLKSASISLPNKDSLIELIISEGLKYGFAPIEYLQIFNNDQKHSLSHLVSSNDVSNNSTSIISPRVHSERPNVPSNIPPVPPREPPQKIQSPRIDSVRNTANYQKMNYNNARQLAPLNSNVPPITIQQDLFSDLE